MAILNMFLTLTLTLNEQPSLRCVVKLMLTSTVLKVD